MQPYQEEYVNNTKQIARLSYMYNGTDSGFAAWYAARRTAEEEIGRLYERNVLLLKEQLFVSLDALWSASEETIDELVQFSDALMDWKTNLDCGVYVAIHEALLRLYRIRRSKDDVIRELYKVGMGRYFLNRAIGNIDSTKCRDLRFRNEMLFTEAASWFPYFDTFTSDETRGYIIRAAANIAIATSNPHRKIAASARVLQIIRDPHYREAAPDLPWDAWLRGTHQQMSANRTDLSRSDLSREELAYILDSCHEIFKPEKDVENPSIRWLWPYYEMEFNCGYVGLEMTLDRLERLIMMSPEDQYDMSGLYGNVQLVLYYGRLLQTNPKQLSQPARRKFLIAADERMLRVLLSCPHEKADDFTFYLVEQVISNYFETDGNLSYRELTTLLMQRYAGELYIRGCRAADIMQICCAFILKSDPGYFDDLVLPENAESGTAGEALLEYAAGCGLYFDFGLLKMNISRLMETRELFEIEQEIYELHTISGYADLAGRRSTRMFADVALGHHRYYNGDSGYPEKYVRHSSPCRKMTDIAALTDWLLETDSLFRKRGEHGSSAKERMTFMKEQALALSGSQFAPAAAECLADAHTADEIAAVLDNDSMEYYRTIYEHAAAQGVQKES